MSSGSEATSNDAVVLLDTVCLLDPVLRRARCARHDAAVAGREVRLNAFSQAEVGRRRDARLGPAAHGDAGTALREPDILEVTDGVVRSYARLRALAKRLGHPLHGEAQLLDRWIAATALHYRVPLLTGNRKHFDGLSGLELADPP